jgi:hypothetical protein
MRKISSYLKLLLTIILVITLVQTTPIKGEEGSSEMITYDLITDGTIYTIINNASYSIEIGNYSNITFECETYNADGECIETFGSSHCAGCAWFYMTIPAGGKVVYYYEANDEEFLRFEYLAEYKSMLVVDEIIIPEGEITEGGRYRLDPEMMYTLGSGEWLIEGDSTVYKGGSVFYVDKLGDYKLTLR